MRERVGSEATKRTRVPVIDLTRVEKSCVSANNINLENFKKLSVPALLQRGAVAALLAMLSAQTPAATPHDPKLDDKTAAELRQQAGKGNASAALHLGNLLARDRVPAAKYGKAVDWYKKGCALGDLSACHNTGVSYEHGRNGAKPDNTEAANYYLKSAERAFLPSLLNLAILHADGRVNSLDNRDGLKWMLIAQKAAAQCPDKPVCKSVLEDKRGYRARLEAQLSADERREARQLADHWQPLR